MFSTGTNLDLLNGYVMRGTDRAVANIQPLDKAEAAYNKAVKTLLKSIESVKNVLSREADIYSYEIAKVDKAIEKATQQKNAAQEELNAIIMKDELNDSEAGIVAGGRLAYHEQRIKSYMATKGSIHQFSDKGKADLRAALETEQEAEGEFYRARTAYVYSIDKHMIDNALNLLEGTNINIESISSIINRPVIKDAFAPGPEVRRLIDYSSNDLVNLIIHGEK